LYCGIGIIAEDDVDVGIVHDFGGMLIPVTNDFHTLETEGSDKSSHNSFMTIQQEESSKDVIVLLCGGVSYCNCACIHHSNVVINAHDPVTCMVTTPIARGEQLLAQYTFHGNVFEEGPSIQDADTVAVSFVCAAPGCDAVVLVRHASVNNE
jgi:hypothetical protein